VITLAIGISGPGIAVSLLAAMALDTPVTGGDGVFVRVLRADRSPSAVATLPEYESFRDQSQSAQSLAAWSVMVMTAREGIGNPVPVSGILVSCNFFDVLSVGAPILGRLLAESDCDSTHPVAVLSERVWRERFNGRASIVGASILYGGVAVSIIGVAPAPSIQRRGQFSEANSSADLIFPISAQRELRNIESMLQGVDLLAPANTLPWLEMAGILRPGVSREQAEAEFRVIGARHGAAGPFGSEVVLTDGSRWEAMPLQVLGMSGIVLILPTLILVTACINVASLLVPRSLARRREMAVRVALGTSRGSLVRMLAIETLMVCLMALLVSFAMIENLAPLVVRLFDIDAWFGSGPIRINWLVYCGVAVSGIVAAAVAGLMPALEALNPHLVESLRSTEPVSVVPRTRRRGFFVAAQVASSTLLLVVAVVFVRVSGQATSPGFSTDGLVVAEVTEETPNRISMHDLLDQLRASSAVTSGAYSNSVPVVSEGAVAVRVGTDTPWVYTAAASVSQGYFGLFGIPLLSGRLFTEEDEFMGDRSGTVVVSERFAAQFFGDRDIVGKSLLRLGPEGSRTMKIVGLVGNRVTGRTVTAAQNSEAVVYEVVDESADSGILFLKARGDIDRALADVRDRLQGLTGSAAVVDTFDGRLEARAGTVRRLGTIVVVLAGASVVLAIAGLVGAISADVKRRRKEFAIRLVLGASPLGIRKGILFSGLRYVGVGVSGGVCAAWIALTVVSRLRLLPLEASATSVGPYLTVAVALFVLSTTVLSAVAYQAGRWGLASALRDE
jgi:predicted permease